MMHIKFYFHPITAFFLFLLSANIQSADSEQGNLLFPSKVKGHTYVEARIKDETLSPKDFQTRLEYSLTHWKKEGMRAVFLCIPKKLLEYALIARQFSFDLYHATSDYIVLTLWLEEGVPNVLQPYPKLSASVAALVVDENNNILTVKDRFKSYELGGFGYKLPGGAIDHAENIGDAAEVKEETGIDTEFMSVIAFKHSHNQPWSTELVSKFYFCCLLRPLNHEITIQQCELQDAKWMSLEEWNSAPRGVFSQFVDAWQTGHAPAYIQPQHDIQKNAVLYKTTAKYKNVIFDIGGVLLDGDGNYFAQKLFEGEKADLFKNFVKTEAWSNWDKGLLTKEQLANALSVNADRQEVERFIEAFLSPDRALIQESVDMVKKLRLQGYKVYLLSNFSHEAHKALINTHEEFYNLFDGHIFSCHCGFAKPDSRIYLKLLEKYHLDLADCIFIDDSKANIDASMQLGIRSVLFKKGELENALNKYHLF